MLAISLFEQPLMQTEADTHALLCHTEKSRKDLTLSRGGHTLQGGAAPSSPLPHHRADAQAGQAWGLF